ncbi:MAG TPA: aromatic amino acid ammonia-lyase [Actinocrinis sp.]|nr:aromatic amino acid ammonia-lyase [Actinocrinis sp.]
MLDDAAAATVVLDGSSLSAAEVSALATGRLRALVDPAARTRVAAARGVAEQIAARRRVYGHTTGVGANRSTDLSSVTPQDVGMRLLRSHSGGIGPIVPAEHTRAMVAVRLNQILGAGSAIGVEVVDTLAAALAGGHVPTAHGYGAIGTADLSALAELGLTLAGELPWRAGAGTGPPPAPIRLDSWDALPLMSSSALTIGQAALGAAELRRLLDTVPLIAALTLTAIHGGTEPYAAEVHRRRPHTGASATAARMRELLAAPDWQPQFVQDPYGLRTLPQVHGAALDSWDALDRVLDIEINAAAENPLLSAGDYHHHGGFHQASLSLALDQFRLALLGTAHLSTARLGVLVEPAFTGLPPFLAQAEDGSSGVMITEYAAQSALADLRTAAQPPTLGHAVISRGVEEHASFASTGARRLLDCVEQFRLVLACELMAAVRALRMHRRMPTGSAQLREFYDSAARVLDPEIADRDLTQDVHFAAALLA